MKYVELGGWAVSERARGTAAPLALALAVWAFSRRGRGALGLTTATYRHCSATILKRLGGRSGVNALMARYGLGTRLEVDSAHEWFTALAQADSAAKFHDDDTVHLGLSSARDMGRLLEMIVRGQVVSQAASAQMMQMMRGQLYASRLPRDLPLAYRFPHKTGDYPPMLQNDVGIVETGDKHVVVVVFASHHKGDGLLLDQTIGRIGQMISDYFARP